MTSDEKLRVDYEQVVGIFSQLSDIRFKLLAFIPAASAAAIGLIGKGSSFSTRDRIAFCSLGFLVTLGIVFYDQRNSQFYNSAVGRAQSLESLLELPSFRGDWQGGWFSSRPGWGRKLLGVLDMRHDAGLALVYSAVLSAWLYGAVSAVATSLGVVAALVTFLLIGAELLRLGRPGDSYSGEVAARPDAVWQLVQDVARWPSWNPDLKTIELKNGLRERSAGRAEIAGGRARTIRVTSAIPGVGFEMRSGNVFQSRVFRVTLGPEPGATQVRLLVRTEGLAAVLDYRRGHWQHTFDQVVHRMQTEVQRPVTNARAAVESGRPRR